MRGGGGGGGGGGCVLHGLLLLVHVAVVVADGVGGAGGRTQHLLGAGTVRPRSRLGRVRERQPRGVDDAVAAHQRDGHLRPSNRVSMAAIIRHVLPVGRAHVDALDAK